MVGVSGGVVVGVGVGLRLGDTVSVGVRVLAGAMVSLRAAVFVSLGETVREGVVLGVADKLQPATTHALNTVINNRFTCVLRSNIVQGGNIEKRVMITDFTF
jgi:hypothetical protein